MHSPDGATCGTKVYDFFMTSKDISPAVFAVVVVGDTCFSTHSPVRISLRAALRSMMCRTLAAPRGFEAVLQHGPHTQEVDTLDKEAGTIAE